MSITTKTRFWDSSVQVRQQSLDQPGTWGLVLHIVGLLLVFGRTLLALVTYIYGDTYSLVGDVVVRIVVKLVKSSFN